MKGGYESMIWVNDNEGREYVCNIDDVGEDISHRENLTEADLRKCLNVNELVGTERW